MSVALVVMAKDEEAIIGRAVESARPLVDTWTLLDTGSTDRTPEIVQDALSGLPGLVQHVPFVDFAQARTAALRAARDTADWLLMLDADQTVEAHPDLREWLATDPDPTTDVWQVPVVEAGVTWRMPRLTRGGVEWTYRDPTHEWLDTDRKQRPLLGLTIRHHADSSGRADKHERDVRLLAPAVERGEPRAIYYTAQALLALGRTDEAADLYERRAFMQGTWEEERWHAAYRAATIRRDVGGLLRVYEQRPWRAEPLRRAAEIVAENGSQSDVLFLEA